ncbi:MAG: LamG domain-containing protein, partial [bacterium]|nr:LamG domain-containing protein [bacterium]
DLRWRQGDGIAYSPLGWAGFFSEGTNQWYHVAAVRDTSAGTITVYKNGSRFGAPQSYTVGAVASSYPLRLGRRGGGDLYFAGMMDDVSLYTTTLTTTRIQQLYAEGRERHLAEQ